MVRLRMRDNEKGLSRPRCPRCGWGDTRLSGAHGLVDRLLSTLSLAPYRCRSCGSRFYRLRRVPRSAEAGQ